jgi:hypothetical protein
MKIFLSARMRGLLAVVSLVQVMPVLRAAPVVDQTAVNAPVTVKDDGRTWTLDNGVVKAVIDKTLPLRRRRAA